MNDVESRFVRADSLIAEYVAKEPKFENRFTSPLDDMKAFVEAAGYAGKVEVNAAVLGCALVDYFEDIERLKSFHRIEHVNSIKIVAYTSYWLLRRRPFLAIRGSRCGAMGFNKVEISS